MKRQQQALFEPRGGAIPSEKTLDERLGEFGEQRRAQQARYSRETRHPRSSRAPAADPASATEGSTSGGAMAHEQQQEPRLSNDTTDTFLVHAPTDSEPAFSETLLRPGMSMRIGPGVNVSDANGEPLGAVTTGGSLSETLSRGPSRVRAFTNAEQIEPVVVEVSGQAALVVYPRQRVAFLADAGEPISVLYERDGRRLGARDADSSTTERWVVRDGKVRRQSGAESAAPDSSERTTKKSKSKSKRSPWWRWLMLALAGVAVLGAVILVLRYPRHRVPMLYVGGVGSESLP